MLIDQLVDAWQAFDDCLRLRRLLGPMRAQKPSVLERRCLVVESGRIQPPFSRTLIFYESVAPQRQHRHRFIELLLSLDTRPITIDYGDRIDSGLGHVVAPLQRHAIVLCGAVARLYIAIGTRRIEPLRGITGVVPGDHTKLRELLLAVASRSSQRDEEGVTLEWQQNWLPNYDTAPDLDPRILLSLEVINAQSDPITARAILASHSRLSPSRFGALFLQEMGMPLRQYILWRRILIALEYLKAGETTTSAALAAGFADAPHLCRCYRATFGSPPSLLPVGRLIQHGEGREFLTQMRGTFTITMPG